MQFLAARQFGSDRVTFLIFRQSGLVLTLSQRKNMLLFDFLSEIPQTDDPSRRLRRKAGETTVPCRDSDHADISSSFSRLLHRRASIPLSARRDRLQIATSSYIIIRHCVCTYTPRIWHDRQDLMSLDRAYGRPRTATLRCHPSLWNELQLYASEPRALKK